MISKRIENYIMATGLLIGLVVVAYYTYTPEPDLTTLFYSSLSFVSFFLRKSLTKYVTGFLGLNSESIDIKNLKEADEEVVSRLDETQQDLRDTQQLTGQLLNQLDAVIERMDKEATKPKLSTTEIKKLRESLNERLKREDS